jgi:polar amino acid transport system substrate-binding protein
MGITKRAFLAALATPLFRATAAESTPLRVGMELAYPPFEMADPQGKPIGLSVDLATHLANHLTRPLEIQNLPFDGLIPALRTGKIDLILSSMTATPERAKAVAFSTPYLRTGLAVLAGKQVRLEESESLDRKDLIIAVKQGTTGHLFCRTFTRAKVLVLDRESACVAEVVQGKASAFIYDQLSILKHARKNPSSTRALLSPLRIEEWAIALKKDAPTLLADVNAFIASFKLKGGFETLAERWLPEEKQAFKDAGIPFVL